jgi:hypothetical protein
MADVARAVRQFQGKRGVDARADVLDVEFYEAPKVRNVGDFHYSVGLGSGEEGAEEFEKRPLEASDPAGILSWLRDWGSKPAPFDTGADLAKAPADLTKALYVLPSPQEDAMKTMSYQNRGWSPGGFRLAATGGALGGADVATFIDPWGEEPAPRAVSDSAARVVIPIRTILGLCYGLILLTVGVVLAVERAIGPLEVLLLLLCGGGLVASAAGYLRLLSRPQVVSSRRSNESAGPR